MKDLVFTIDVEEWYHAENLRPYLDTRILKNKYSTINYTYKVLDFLDECNSKGTFFFLGCIAKVYPELVKEVVVRGHEIASHGLNHDLLWDMSEKQTHEDIDVSTKIIEDVSGKKIIGYRSPCFSQNAFIADALEKNGFEYSSMSIESTFHDRYEANSFKCTNRLQDFPMPVTEIGKFKIVSTGGGWFRFFSVGIQNWLLNRCKKDPLIFYCHPWDFGKNFWGDAKVPLIKKLRHTIGTETALNKLNHFKFGKKPLKSFLD